MMDMNAKTYLRQVEGLAESVAIFEDALDHADALFAPLLAGPRPELDEDRRQAVAAQLDAAIAAMPGHLERLKKHAARLAPPPAKKAEKPKRTPASETDV